MKDNSMETLVQKIKWLLVEMKVSSRKRKKKRVRKKMEKGMSMKKLKRMETMKITREQETSLGRWSKSDSNSKGWDLARKRNTILWKKMTMTMTVKTTEFD